MTAHPFTLARSSAVADETFPTLEAMAARIAVLMDGHPLATLKPAVVARGRLPSGPCAKLTAGDGALIGYAFGPEPLIATDLCVEMLLQRFAAAGLARAA